MIFSDFNDAGAPKAVKAGIDSVDCRKKRQEASVQIRKARREDNLRKRRQTSAEEPPASAGGAADAGENASGLEIPCKVSELPRMLAAIQSSSLEENLAGTKTVRKLLSRATKPPVREVIDAGFLPFLCESLKREDSTALQFEAAWALTNVGSSDLTVEIVKAGVLPLLVPLLRSGEPTVREQAAWCVGNIAGDCSELRDQVLATPGLPEGLLLNLQHPANVNMMRNVTWAVSNLCRGSKPKPALNMVAPYVPVLARIIESCGDEETIVDACWALSYVSDGENERLDLIASTGVCPALVNLLRTGGDKCVAPCLRTLGNIVTGTEQHTQAAIDAGVLRELATLASHVKTSVRKEVAWTASNVTAGTREQIGAFLAMPGLPEAIISALQEGEWQVRKEAAWTVANICTGGSTEHIRSIVERHGVVAPLCDLLSAADNKVLQLALSTLESILKVDAERYGVMVEECGGLEAIEGLQQHSSDEIYDKARQLIEDYFGTDEDDAENTVAGAPDVDDSGAFFSFTQGKSPMVGLADPASENPDVPLNFAPISFA